MSGEEVHPKRTRRVSPAVAMHARLREEFEPFYKHMSDWNEELASLTEQLRRHPEDRERLRAELSRLSRAIQLGRNQALRRVEQLAAGQLTAIGEDADRASALLLKRIETALLHS